MTLLYSYSQVLYDGNWGTVSRPIIKELLAFKDKYRGSFFNLRRAIRIGMIEDEAGELELDYFLEVGAETFSLEILLPTITDVKNVLDQIRKINRAYKQEADYAAVEISNVKIENRKGRYYSTCIVKAIKASEDT